MVDPCTKTAACVSLILLKTEPKDVLAPEEEVTEYTTDFQARPANPLEAVASIVRLPQLARGDGITRLTTGVVGEVGGCSLIDMALLKSVQAGEQAAFNTFASKDTESPGTIVAVLSRVILACVWDIQRQVDVELPANKKTLLQSQLPDPDCTTVTAYKYISIIMTRINSERIYALYLVCR